MVCASLYLHFLTIIPYFGGSSLPDDIAAWLKPIKILSSAGCLKYENAQTTGTGSYEVYMETPNAKVEEWIESVRQFCKSNAPQ